LHIVTAEIELIWGQQIKIFIHQPIHIQANSIAFIIILPGIRAGIQIENKQVVIARSDRGNRRLEIAIAVPLFKNDLVLNGGVVKANEIFTPPRLRGTLPAP
jgi:hypothetical protein